MKKYKHLPHLNQINSYQFITFRTKASLDDYLIKLYNSNDPEKIKQYKMDSYLDRSKKGALLYGDLLEKIKTYYLNYEKHVFEVVALSIMPNHIHILLKQNDDLSQCSTYIKRRCGAYYQSNA